MSERDVQAAASGHDYDERRDAADEAVDLSAISANNATRGAGLGDRGKQNAACGRDEADPSASSAEVGASSGGQSAASSGQLYASPATATAAREEVTMMQEELLAALRAITEIPSERTLLLNAEARAMYEIAKRALERAEADRG